MLQSDATRGFKRVLALLIVVLSVWVCYWAHRLKSGGVSSRYKYKLMHARTGTGTINTTEKLRKSLAFVGGVQKTTAEFVATAPVMSTRAMLSSSTPRETTHHLWNSVGCDSKYPILACQKRGQARRTDQSENCIGANRSDFDTHPILQRRWKSCAVVGSSGSLLLHERGKEIDEHEIVARINYPPVKGYEKHVGCRPGDIQFWGDRITRCYNESTEKTLIVRQLPSGWGARKTSRSFCERNANMEMFSISKYVFDTGRKMVNDYFREHPLLKEKGSGMNRLATSGFRAVLFCLLICDSVDAYGFGINQTTPYHYFENGIVSARSLDAHYWNAELEIMKTWPNTTHPSQFGRLTWIP